jgi:hypothetical protein
VKTSDLQCILSDIDNSLMSSARLTHDWERSATAKRSVMASMRPYHEILVDRKKKEVTTVHTACFL